jgi:hypothetical protein
LRHDRQMASIRRQIDFRKIASVQTDTALLRVLKAQNQIEQGRFAGA